MKRKAIFAGALLPIFILGFASLVLAQADPEFKALLARLSGGRWFIAEDGEGKAYLELQGDFLTKWYAEKKTGNKVKQWSVKLDKPRAVVKTDTYAAIYEISQDGDWITEEVTWNKFAPDSVGGVRKLVKEK